MAQKKKDHFIVTQLKTRHAFVNNVCRQIYSHKLGEGDGGAICEGDGCLRFFIIKKLECSSLLYQAIGVIFS